MARCWGTTRPEPHGHSRRRPLPQARPCGSPCHSRSAWPAARSHTEEGSSNGCCPAALPRVSRANVPSAMAPLKPLRYRRGERKQGRRGRQNAARAQQRRLDAPRASEQIAVAAARSTNPNVRRHQYVSPSASACTITGVCPLSSSGKRLTSRCRLRTKHPRGSAARRAGHRPPVSVVDGAIARRGGVR